MVGKDLEDQAARPHQEFPGVPAQVTLVSYVEIMEGISNVVQSALTLI